MWANKVKSFVILTSLFWGTFGMSAYAQSWPQKPIKFIVPFSAGGANDLMARAAAEGASKVLGQTIVVRTSQELEALLEPFLSAKVLPMATHF